MKVLFLPPAGKDTPYQGLMSKSLSLLGVKVVFPKRYTDLLPFSPIFATVYAWRPKVIHLHWVLTFFLSKTKTTTFIRLIIFLLSLVVLKKLLRIRLVWEIHDKYNHERKHLLLDISASRIISRLSDALIVHSQAAKSEITQLFEIKDKSKIKVIPHGNYISAYPNTVSKKQAREELCLNETDFVFLFLGKMMPYKGLMVMIDVFNQLSHPEAKLVIAGKPVNSATKHELLNKCKANSDIKLDLTFIPYEKVQTYMNAADTVVLPYTEILTSGVTVLAMSFGKPVIAPAVGCIPETLPNSQKELLYDPLEGGALFKKMELAMKLDLERIGEDNFRKAVDELDWDKVAEQMIREAYTS